MTTIPPELLEALSKQPPKPPSWATNLTDLKHWDDPWRRFVWRSQYMADLTVQSFYRLEAR